jgi:hypothetical protein
VTPLEPKEYKVIIVFAEYILHLWSSIVSSASLPKFYIFIPFKTIFIFWGVNSPPPPPPPGKIIGTTSKIVKPEILMKGPLYVV